MYITEELAETLGIPADALQVTVDMYNQSIEQGEDTAFGVSVEQMDRIEAYVKQYARDMKR